MPSRSLISACLFAAVAAHAQEPVPDQHALGWLNSALLLCSRHAAPLGTPASEAYLQLVVDLGPLTATEGPRERQFYEGMLDHQESLAKLVTSPRQDPAAAFDAHFTVSRCTRFADQARGYLEHISVR